MSFKKIFIVFFIYLFHLSFVLFSQDNLDDFIQNNFPIPQSDENYGEIYENLYQYYTNPLDLNTASAQELKALYLLTDQQIESLQAHKAKYGKLLSIYELQSIALFDLATIKKIVAFVRIRENKYGKNLFQRIREEKNTYLLARFSRDIEQRRGYKNPFPAGYEGNAWQTYFRFRSSHTKDFSFGFTLEKDAGEKKYNDFFSAHIFLYNKNNFNAIGIGDFRVQMGQGLVLAAGLNLGKGAEPILTTRRNSIGILPYTSVIESGFFRGLALDYQLLRNIKCIFLLSQKRQDATLNDSIAQSIHTTGYHRTRNEIDKQNNLYERNLGIAFQYNNRNTELGMTYLFTYFDKNLQGTDRIYNRFYFSGNTNQNLSFFYNITHQNFNFFGETAISQSLGRAFVGGVLSNLSQKVQTSLLFRHYDKNFHNLYGSAFGENTLNQNEQGNYWGLKIVFNKQWQLNTYIDFFRFDWLKFMTNSPSKGYNYLFRLTYQAQKFAQIYLQFAQESKARNAENQVQKAVLPALKTNFQLNAEVNIEPNLKLRTRLQASSLDFNGVFSSGFLVFQDINYRYKNLQLSQRFALFDTDNYDNRQYVYEQDVLYTFYFPAYYNKGIRNYLILHYTLNQNFDFWIKYSITSYQNITKISSGLEQIDGNTLQDIRFQMRYRL